MLKNERNMKFSPAIGCSFCKDYFLQLILLPYFCTVLGLVEGCVSFGLRVFFFFFKKVKF